jgi:hypothetical protein
MCVGRNTLQSGNSCLVSKWNWPTVNSGIIYLPRPHSEIPYFWEIGLRYKQRGKDKTLPDGEEALLAQSLIDWAHLVWGMF